MIGEKTKNVDILDLRNAAREDMEQMGGIENIGVILVSEELLGLMSLKKNVGVVLTYRAGERIFMDKTRINITMLESLEEPIEFLHTRKLTISDDVTPDLIKENIKGFRITVF